MDFVKGSKSIYGKQKEDLSKEVVNDYLVIDNLNNFVIEVDDNVNVFHGMKGKDVDYEGKIRSKGIEKVVVISFKVMYFIKVAHDELGKELETTFENYYLVYYVNLTSKDLII